jgi:ABC-type dipeptide/oligopeptide/nickel transport system ATPase component
MTVSVNHVVEDNDYRGKDRKVILEVNNLKVYYATPTGEVRAVDNVSFKVYQGEIVGLVGESGCGKTTTAMAILRLVQPPGRIVGGEILLDGINLATLQGPELRAVRWDRLALIPQGAMNSLNPVMRISKQIADKDPRTRGSERTRRAFSVEVVTVLLSEREITNNVSVNTLVDSPSLPSIEVVTHFKVNEAVSERHRHAIRDTLVTVAVTSSNDNNVIRQLILTNPTIEDQLITSSLHSRGSRIHLIEEKNYDWVLCSEFFAGKIDGLGPIHLTDFLIEVRDTTNVSRFHLRHTQIDHVTTEFVSDVLNAFGLADTRRAPQEDWTLDLKRSKNSLAGLN